MLLKRSHSGFTLIEILVVLTIIAILLSLVTPRYFSSIDRAKEKVLRHDLIVVRDAIDKFYSDRNAYPNTLQDLVQGKYLREVPVDPITDRTDTWGFVEPSEYDAQGTIADIHSGSQLISSRGTVYADW